MAKPIYGDRRYDLLIQATLKYLELLFDEDHREQDGDTCEQLDKFVTRAKPIITKWKRVREQQSAGGEEGARRRFHSK